MERVSAEEFAAAELAWKGLGRQTRRYIGAGLRRGHLPADQHQRAVLRAYAYASVWRERPESKGLDLGSRVMGAAVAGALAGDGDISLVGSRAEKRLVRRALRLFLEQDELSPG